MTVPYKNPPCFTPEQWKSYRRFLSDGSSYCRDCTPEFKDRMCDQRKCEHPGVTFKFVTGEGLVGVRKATNEGSQVVL